MLSWGDHQWIQTIFFKELIGHAVSISELCRTRDELDFKSRYTPICSFSKGSSISFRLASRRISVQIYQGWNYTVVKSHYRHLNVFKFLNNLCSVYRCSVDSSPLGGDILHAVPGQFPLTLWIVAPRLARQDKESMSTLRLYVCPVTR